MKHFIKYNFQSVTSLFILIQIILIVSTAVAQTPREQFKNYPTGLNKSEMDLINAKNKYRITKVRPNELAIERMNKVLLKTGKAPLDLRDAASKADEISLESVTGGASVVTTLTGDATAAVVLSSVDNQTLPAFPPIGSQGNENSCFPFNVTYYMMSHETCLVKGCNNKSGDLTNIFSPRWIYNQVSQGANAGCCQGKLWEVLEQHGAPNLIQLPYIPGDYMRWDLNTENWISAISNRMNRFAPINVSTSTGQSTLKQYLANGHVVVVGTYIYSFVYVRIGSNPATSNPFAGQWAVSHLNGTDGGHAMTIVGYDDNIWVDVNANGSVDSGELGAFKVVNSWGTGYSNGGYVWASYDAFKSASAVTSPPSPRVAFSQDGNVWGTTARVNYAPKILAQFTVNHAARNQLAINIGTSSLTSSSPTSLWSPAMIQNQGGAFAFDGSTNAVDGTFVFDFSDLVPAGVSSLNYYLKMSDSTSGSAATLKDFRLIDVERRQEVISATALPLTADAGTATAKVSYNFNDGNIPPVAVLTTSVQTNDTSVTVNFDAGGSYDTDGSIAAYAWNFGDGATQMGGATASHLYTRAGTFNAVVTVTDNKGATATASYTVSVKDNEAPSAPVLSGAVVTTTARGKGKRATTSTSVKLTWTASTDNVGVVRYAVYRNGVVMNSSVTGTTFTDSSTVAGGGNYSYYVIAYDAAGNPSPVSNAVDVSR